MHNFDTAQFLWVEGPLSLIEQLCLSSFVFHGYSVHLYTYGDVTGVPPGVIVLSGEEILPRSLLFKADGVGLPSFASFADLFRLELLLRRGGWWFDMDMVCLQHLPPPSELTFASTWEGQWGECASNCAIWCLPDDPHIAELAFRARSIVQSGDISFGSIGPFLVQSLVRERNLDANVAPWSEFCPYPWRLVYRLAHPTLQSYAKDQIRSLKHFIWQRFSSTFRAACLRPHSRTLHLHNEIWKARGLDKNARYFFFSPIEKLKRRYLLDYEVTLG